MPRSWRAKFGDAFRGVWQALARERSFAVHLPAGGLVILAGALLQVSAAEWGVLLLAIATVLAAETFNTALEHLARAATADQNDNVGRALDMASGAVLIASCGAAAAGAAVLGYRAGLWLGWWG